ncbi:MAG TPA: hypothetical protein VFU23_00470 [Gemmatimonadales bacterium]|nr:hypothetical protein [Gemmatimonadales bacterium]
MCASRRGSVGRALAYDIPHARRVVIPSGGHLVNLIQPERCNPALLAFLAMHPGT